MLDRINICPQPQEGYCLSNETSFLGNPNMTADRGKFYLETNSLPPYGKSSTKAAPNRDSVFKRVWSYITSWGWNLVPFLQHICDKYMTKIGASMNCLLPALISHSLCPLRQWPLDCFWAFQWGLSCTRPLASLLGSSGAFSTWQTFRVVQSRSRLQEWFGRQTRSLQSTDPGHHGLQ